MPCPCPFCTVAPRQTERLPVPVRVMMPEGGLARWAWLVRVTSSALELCVTEGAHAVRYTTLKKATDAVYAAHGCACPHRTSDLGGMWHALTSDRRIITLDQLVQRISRGNVDAPPFLGTSSICTKSTGAIQMPRVMAGPGPSTTTRKVRRPRARAAEKPPPPESGDDTEECLPHLAYDPRSMGGDASKVESILQARPDPHEWDEEVIEELLRWGARPRLHRASRAIRKATYTTVCCTFIHPSGKLLGDVWLDLGTLRLEYPSHVSGLSVE